MVVPKYQVKMGKWGNRSVAMFTGHYPTAPDCSKAKYYAAT